MICDNELKNLIQLLVEETDALTVVGQAFAPIGEKYGVGKLVAIMVAPPAFYSQNGERASAVMYEQEGLAEEEPALCFNYETHEKGIVQYLIYKRKDRQAYTEEEQKDLQTVLNIVFVHCGRWRLGNLIQKMGHTDILTGLPNSAGFLQHVESLLKKKELQKYNAYYFNLTRFSLVNKRFGERETDRIIIRYTRQLLKFLMGEECIGRLGGDNFVALIYKERTEEFLSLLEGVSTFGVLNGQEIMICISADAGVCEIDENIREVGAVINDSAMALRIAKYVNKTPYAFATEEVRETFFRERQIASSFTEALAKGEFKTYYQPKVRLEDYAIVGAEALVRWEHDGRLIKPIEFVSILEQNGSICFLDYCMLEQACKDIKEWIAKGLQPIRVSVNFSRKHLSNPQLANEIAAILKRYDVAKEYIEIELTETADEIESELFIDFMQKMKQYGIAMSIDDFGTGYSSLNMLRSFSVDVLKIDKSFIDNCGEKDRIVLTNIINMASQLQMEIVAEGVETWEQVNYLKEVKCDIVQGFLFDKPMPKAIFEEKLRGGKYCIND